MFQLTPAQRNTLKTMPRHRVLAHLHTGGVIVVGNKQFQNALVIDFDGRVYALIQYLIILDRRS